MVTNQAANKNGDTLTNSATVSYTTGAGIQTITDTANVDIVEPQLSITKTASPTSGNGGDLITYTVTVAHTGASRADAFDVSIADTLPPELVWVGNVTPVIGPAPGVVVAGQNLLFQWSSLPLTDGSYSFHFDAQLTSAVTIGQTITNTANLEYSSLPGIDPNERTYTGSSSAVVTSTAMAQNPAKTLVATSEAFTTGTGVAIGEIVRYRLQLQLTEGTFPNLQFVDTLPSGLTLLDPTTQVTVSFTSDLPMGLAGDLAGANNNAVPPNFVLPAARITVNGQQLTFSLGDVQNNDDDPPPEVVTLEYNALVMNTSVNQDGDTKSNAFQALVNGIQYGATQTTTVTVKEPSITNVDKQLVGTPAITAGSPVTYTVSYSNTGQTTAFEVRLLDALPAAFASAAVDSVTLAGGAAGVTDSTVGTSVDVTIGTVPVGGGVTVRYTGVLGATVQTPATNTALVSYTSLPDTGTTGNPTGSNTPGAPGQPDGERNGSGGVNDYYDSDSTTPVPLADLQITKTGDPNPVLAGQVLSYTIAVTNAGPSDTVGANVADTFPANLTGVTWAVTAASGGATSSPDNGTNPLSATVTMPAGSTLTYTVHATVGAGATGSLSNTATVTPPPLVTDPNLGNNTATATVLLGSLIDNGGPGFSTGGNWILGSPCAGFFGDDVIYARPAPPQASASWTFTGLTPGANYQVSTSWYSPPAFASNRATNAPFTISGGAAPVTILVNQQLNPIDYAPHFTYLGSEWMNLSGSYKVTGTTLTVTLANTANGYCLGDAVLVQQLPAALPAPAPAPLPSPPTGSGEGELPPPVASPSVEPSAAARGILLDNADPGYATSGSWSSLTGAGYNAGSQTAPASTCGDRFATWQFTGLSPWVTYRVYATWVPGANRSTTATYRLFQDVASPLNMSSRVQVNQRGTPSDLTQNGVAWQLLGSLTPSRDTLNVQVVNTGEGVVNADAVWLEPLLPPAAPELVVLMNGQRVPQGSGQVDFGTTIVGWPQQKTFVVRNQGNELLQLMPSVTVPDGFAVSCSAVTQLKPGESALFTLTQPATIAGSVTGLVSVLSNDSQASPFTFAVTSEVVVGLDAANVPSSGSRGVTITPTQVLPILAAAIDQWTLAGLSQAEKTQILSLPVMVRDLPGRTLAAASREGLLLDADAAGLGWFVDASPWEDAEFVIGTRPAGVDLVTAVLNSLGRTLGREHSSPPAAGLMTLGELDAQARWVPAGVLHTGQNPLLPTDVDGNGQVAPLDALHVINRINAGGAPLSPVQSGVPPVYFDVNGDNRLSPLDVLNVINYLNTNFGRQGEGEGVAAVPGTASRLVGSSRLDQEEFPSRSLADGGDHDGWAMRRGQPSPHRS